MVILKESNMTDPDWLRNDICDVLDLINTIKYKLISAGLDSAEIREYLSNIDMDLNGIVAELSNLDA